MITALKIRLSSLFFISYRYNTCVYTNKTNIFFLYKEKEVKSSDSRNVLCSFVWMFLSTKAHNLNVAELFVPAFFFWFFYKRIWLLSLAKLWKVTSIRKIGYKYPQTYRLKMNTHHSILKKKVHRKKKFLLITFVPPSFLFSVFVLFFSFRRSSGNYASALKSLFFFE